jgi:chemotaxis signal transduction protein
MTAELSLPSEDLNKPFVLKEPDGTDVKSKVAVTNSSSAFWTHSYYVAGMGLLLPEGTVGEVFDTLPMCRLPNTRDWLHGIASQRGNVVPIYDLARIFNLEKNVENIKRKYFLIGQRDKAIGVLIDDMPARISLNRKDRLTTMPPLPEILQPFVKSCYQKDYKVWVDWDVDAFFMTIGNNI